MLDLRNPVILVMPGVLTFWPPIVPEEMLLQKCKACGQTYDFAPTPRSVSDDEQMRLADAAAAACPRCGESESYLVAGLMRPLSRSEAVAMAGRWWAEYLPKGCMP